MPWVRFTKPFNFHVRHNVTIHYKAGGVYLVKHRCANEAAAAGAAEFCERPAHKSKEAFNAGRR